MICDGQFVGFIFIADSNSNNPGLKIGTIWPFTRSGSWTTDDLELIGRQHINDLLPSTTTDQELQENLINRTLVRNNCKSFIVNQYE